jgi:hypothetical protein
LGEFGRREQLVAGSRVEQEFVGLQQQFYLGNVEADQISQRANLSLASNATLANISS